MFVFHCHSYLCHKVTVLTFEVEVLYRFRSVAVVIFSDLVPNSFEKYWLNLQCHSFNLVTNLSFLPRLYVLSFISLPNFGSIQFYSAILMSEFHIISAMDIWYRLLTIIIISQWDVQLLLIQWASLLILSYIHVVWWYPRKGNRAFLKTQTF